MGNWLARLENFRGTMPDAADSHARKSRWQSLCALLNLTEPEIVSVIARNGFGQAPAEFEASLPSAEDARERLIRWLNGRSKALRQRARNVWETVDRPNRDEAPGRALFDASNEGKLLARYMNDAQRTMRGALKELQKTQKERENLADANLATDHRPRTTCEDSIESRGSQRGRGTHVATTNFAQAPTTGVAAPMMGAVANGDRRLFGMAPED